jgi:hypothetical protein
MHIRKRKFIFTRTDHKQKKTSFYLAGNLLAKIIIYFTFLIMPANLFVAVQLTRGFLIRLS